MKTVMTMQIYLSIWRWLLAMREAASLASQTERQRRRRGDDLMGTIIIMKKNMGPLDNWESKETCCIFFCGCFNFMAAIFL